MKRYHQDWPRIRRAHRLYLRQEHGWPYRPVNCPCDLQAGRFRKKHPLGCPRVGCWCKDYKREPSTRDLRLQALVREALDELQRREFGTLDEE